MFISIFVSSVCLLVRVTMVDKNRAVVCCLHLRDSLSELRSYLCERQLEGPVLRLALLPVNTAQFTQFFFIRCDVTQ
jgi:hypothetical protein